MILTDADAAALIAEAKPMPAAYRQLFEVKPKRGHREREFELIGAAGSQFRVILRQSEFNVLDFSAILAWKPGDSTRTFRLRRYNGKSHQHTNKIEHNTIDGFHIHQITERYQQFGLREDAFAEPTTRYGSFQGAIDCLVEDCNLIPRTDDQLELLGGQSS